MGNLRASLSALRAVMANFPPLESHAPQTPIELDDIYFPRSHSAALDPDRSLVIGNRGMGKSFWASALQDPVARLHISRALPEARLNENIEVRFGFAEGEGAVGVSRDELTSLLQIAHSSEQIWRAVTLEEIAKHAGRKISTRLADRLSFVINKPGEVREIIRLADASLSAKKGKLVFIFDQLEQLSDDLHHRADLTRGILQLALAFKSYRALRVKVFMRPDHFADDKLFDFADASKIKGEALQLDWRTTDLYGLLYTRLLRENQRAFNTIVNNAGINSTSGNRLHASLRESEETQHRLFDIIAGDAMGNRKRGLPYTWLISHLADARNQVSPRTFVRAIKFAAENEPAPAQTAIDHLGIHEGVRKASENRIDDLKEDYPWIPLALESLRTLLVPCLPEEMIGKWKENGQLIDQLKRNLPPAKQPSWLRDSQARNNNRYQALLEAMADVGVIEIRLSTGKVDVPDIFRLKAGIKRKGGITQQQRRRSRTVPS